MHFKRVIIKFARLESFRALKLSKPESFRALRLSKSESFRVLKKEKVYFDCVILFISFTLLFFADYF